MSIWNRFAKAVNFVIVKIWGAITLPVLYIYAIYAVAHCYELDCRYGYWKVDLSRVKTMLQNKTEKFYLFYKNHLCLPYIVTVK